MSLFTASCAALLPFMVISLSSFTAASMNSAILRSGWNSLKTPEHHYLSLMADAWQAVLGAAGAAQQPPAAKRPATDAETVFKELTLSPPSLA